MYYKIVLFIKNLINFNRYRFKKIIHNCDSVDSTYHIKGKYISTKSIAGTCKLVYNVYQHGTCDICIKPYRNKIATNISASRLFNKYGIRFKN